MPLENDNVSRDESWHRKLANEFSERYFDYQLPGMLFLNMVSYFDCDRSDTVPDPLMMEWVKKKKTWDKLDLLSIRFQAEGGLISKTPSNQVTHVILNKHDLSNLEKLTSTFQNERLPRFVTSDWIEACIQNNTIINEGADLSIKKSTLHNFLKTECNLSFKKITLQPVTKNNSMAWSKKGTPAVVTVPKTRATTTTILGAISTEGLIKCCLRLPQPPSSKKRKRGDGVEYMSKGTVMGHYISFLKATMDEMDRYPHMKGHYLVMDNAPIHTSEDIAKYVESRGYHCIYLPSYSPELNPIEQFWSVVKSKVKRHRFLEKETLMTRISEASNSLKLSDFQGIVRHSHKCLDKCRNSQPL
ncbi:hypothetical protein G6F43_012858 [Rhizopus delemar]|nr:hypothetical protein G6F43_012858 [Rhizopus delemar]